MTEDQQHITYEYCTYPSFENRIIVRAGRILPTHMVETRRRSDRPLGSSFALPSIDKPSRTVYSEAAEQAT